MPETIAFKVSKKSGVRSTAAALLGFFREGKEVEMHCIGASAVNQAVKSIVHARADIARLGKDLLVKPGMYNVVQDGAEVTVTVFKFEVR